MFDVLPTNTISFQTATHLIIYMVRDNKQLITAHAHIRGVVLNYHGVVGMTDVRVE